jgi:uncharacterized protein YxjI
MWRITMNLYIKQKVFSWKDRFSIFDENGNERFYVEGEAFSLGKKLRIYDLSGSEVAYIEQKIWSFLPKFNIYRNGAHLCTIVKNFTLFRNEYVIDELGWRVDGNFWDYEYYISNCMGNIVSVYKEWFTWGDTYAVSIDDSVDAIAALAAVIVIDACIAQEG